MHDQNRRIAPGRWCDWRCGLSERWSRADNGATVVESADENRTDDPFRALGCEPCGGIGARVLAEEDELVGIDTELRRVTADEAQGGAHIGERSVDVADPVQPIVEREPVVSRPGHGFENLSDMSDAAPGGPTAAMNDHDRRTTG